MLLTLLCFIGGAKAQNELTVHEGTATSSYVPVYGLWADSYLKCEFVIPATELTPMSGGTVSKMTFYLQTSAQAAWTGTFQVFLKEVAGTTLSAYSGTDDATVVYEGTLDATGSTMEINFSNNYAYSGGNLLVGVYQIEKGNWKSATFYGEAVNGASVQGYSSSSLEAITATQRNFIPKTTFTYTGGTAPLNPPTGLAIINITSSSATASWTASTGATEYTYQYKKASEEAWSTEVTQAETSVALTGLSNNTDYNFRVKAIYSAGPSSFATANFKTLEKWKAPTGLTANNVTYNSAELSWTENSSPSATAWVVGYKIATDEYFTEVNIGTNPFTLTGLAQETTYTVKVRPVTDDASIKWSSTINFTTPEQFPKPTALTASNIASTTADISWTADASATQINLQYAEGPFIENGNWYQYDNGVFSTAVGYGGDPFSWGIMLPAGSYTGNTLNKVSIFDYAGMTGSVTIYNDGNTSPSNAISTMPVTLTGTGDFVEFNLGGLPLDNSKNLWVVFHFESGATWPAATCDDELNDPNGRWIELNGVWKDLANAGVTGQAFMIHAEIGDAKTLAWNTKTDVTSPYTLTGLSPQTEYAVRVKAVYTDGESVWTRTGFITPTAFPTPEGLNVTNIGAKNATISWTASEGATGYAYQYKKASEEAWNTETTQNEISVALTGLSYSTDYDFRVKAIFSDGESDFATINFTTDVEFPNPKALLVSNITSTTADISWTADVSATQINLQYAEGPFIENSNWYQYDNGVNSTAVGYGGNPFSWGIMLPAGSYTGNTLNKVSIFDFDDMTGSVTIYNDGETSPSNAISTMPVTLTGTGDFVEFNLGGLPLDNTKNLWAIFHFESGATYPAATCEDVLNDPNGRWIELNGVWKDLANAGVTGQAFMIHAEIGDAKTLTWNTETDVTSPYTLTELSPLTEHVVWMKAVYTDGESAWARTSFTTEPAPVTSYPWTEDFNSLTRASSIPVGWNNDEGTTTTASYKWCYNTYTSGNGATNGTSYDNSNCVRFNSYTPDNGLTNFLKTLPLVLPASPNMQLTFWYKNPTGGDFTVYISTDGGATHETALATGLTGVSGWTQIDPIDLSAYAGQEVVIVFKGTSNYGSGDAYIYLDDVTVAPSEINITMNEYGIMTYASPYKLDFSSVDGLTAYAVTNISGADLTMTPINVTIEGAGLMLKGTASTNFSVPVSTAEADAAMENNRLIGLLVETDVPQVDGDGNVTYILADGGDGINWYKLAETNYTLKANSAYLKLTPAEVTALGAGARGFNMIFDDGTTAIHALQSAAMETENGAWYTLQGLRLDKKPTTKGIYIHNGHKVVIK